MLSICLSKTNVKCPNKSKLGQVMSAQNLQHSHKVNKDTCTNINGKCQLHAIWVTSFSKYSPSSIGWIVHAGLNPLKMQALAIKS